MHMLVSRQTIIKKYLYTVYYVEINVSMFEKDQAERERAVRNFREGQIHVLVGWNLSSQGIEIPKASDRDSKRP